MNDKLLTYQNFKSIFNDKEYLFESELCKINIIGVRSYCKLKNKFNDKICMTYIDDDGYEHVDIFNGTTLPGRNYLLHPLNIKGTAILVENQYIGSYIYANHKNKYPAICQRTGTVAVIRDNDKDDEWDMIDNIEWGYFGINIHRASKWKIVNWIGKNSAGCQVIQKFSDWKIFISACLYSAERYGNKFNYTLINEIDFLKLT